MPQSYKFYLLLIPIFIISLLYTPQEFMASEYSVDRLSGLDRYETSVMVSQKGWQQGANTVVIAVGENFPDALTGTTLAFAKNAPILLTKRNVLPLSTKNELIRLKPEKVIILGGEGVVNQSVVFSIKELGITDISRIAGADRYETAVKIEESLNSNSDTAILVYGQNFPDSLSIATYAARNNMPILLTQRNAIPGSTLQALKKYKRTIVVGGEGVISPQLYKSLPNPVRYSGNDRYETLNSVVQGLKLPINTKKYVATGESFADALTGSVLAAKDNASLILVKRSQIPSPIQQLLDNSSGNDFTIIGGVGAVSENVSNQLGFNTGALIDTAKSYLGVPYLWGGTTPKGFDCSGFLNHVFNIHGVSMPRTTAEIWNSGKDVATPEIGDIVFFTTYQPGPSHAGIYIGNNEFIHASSTSGVTVHSLSNSYFKPRYLGAKRLH